MSLIVALFWSLVHSLWQGLALHVGALLVTAGSRSAPQRYLLLCAAQLGLMVAFASTLLHELSAASAARAVASLPAHGAQPWLPGLMLGSVAAWAAGLMLMTARLTRTFHGVARLRQSAVPLRAWQPAVARAAARLGLRRAVAIVEAAVDSPLTLTRPWCGTRTVTLASCVTPVRCTTSRLPARMCTGLRIASDGGTILIVTVSLL